ncbi:hypothetical protein GCM10020256_10570 [Streptomyces thermocoprophilus]
MPDVLGRAARLRERLDGLVQELLQLSLRSLRIATGVGSEAVPCRHEMRIDVLLMSPFAVEVDEQAKGVRATLVDARDQPVRLSVSR